MKSTDFSRFFLFDFLGVQLEKLEIFLSKALKANTDEGASAKLTGAAEVQPMTSKSLDENNNAPNSKPNLKEELANGNVGMCT